MCDFSLFLTIAYDYARFVTNIYSDSSLSGFFIQVQDNNVKRIVFSVNCGEVLLNGTGKPHFFFLFVCMSLHSGLCLLLSV